jgi:hypothetical protein
MGVGRIRVATVVVLAASAGRRTMIQASNIETSGSQIALWSHITLWVVNPTRLLQHVTTRAVPRFGWYNKGDAAGCIQRHFPTHLHCKPAVASTYSTCMAPVAVGAGGSTGSVNTYSCDITVMALQVGGSVPRSLLDSRCLRSSRCRGSFPRKARRKRNLGGVAEVHARHNTS